MTIESRSRVAVALVSLCLAFGATAAAASPPRSVVPAVQPVMPADPGGGWAAPPNGGAQPNTTTTSGNATGGQVLQNADGTSDTVMFYVTPNDGSIYGGSYTITTYDSSGKQVGQSGGTVSDPGNGGGWSVGYGAVYVPTGGSVLINLVESNGQGQSFGAGFRLRNYRP